MGKGQGLFVAVVLGCFLTVTELPAASTTWNKTSRTQPGPYDLNDGANWSGGAPNSSVDAFIVFNASGGGGMQQIDTNGAAFAANSLSITNISAGNKGDLLIYFKGTTPITSNLLFAGSTGANIALLNFSNTVSFLNATFAGGAGGNATLTFAGSGSVTGSNLTFTSGAGNNTLLATAAGGINLTSNLTVTVNNANNYVILAANTTVAGKLINSGNQTGYFSITNSTLTVSNGVANTGSIDVLNKGIFKSVPAWTNNGTLFLASGGLATGGTLTNQANGTISGAGVIDSLVINQGHVDFGGTISNNFIQTAGSFTLSDNATVTGSAAITGGNLNLVGKRLSSGLLIIGPSGTLSNTTTGATIASGVTNAGSVFFNNDVYVVGAVTNTGTWTHRGMISNQVVNTGTMTLLKNSINPHVTGGIINTGSLTMDNNGNATVEGSVTNSGSFAFAGTILGNFVQTGGTITVAANGVGNANLIAGTASITGGTFDLNGRTYSNNLMVVRGTGVFTNNVAGASFSGGLSNAATVAVTADTFFKGVVTNTGTFNFRGAVSNTVANAGTIQMTGSGTISGALANTGTIQVNTGILSLSSVPTQNGHIAVASSGTLSVAQAWQNSGTINMTGGTVAGSTLTNAGTITGTAGTFTSALVNQGRLNFAGTIANTFTQTSGGSFTLAGNVTITGATLANAGGIGLSSGQTLTFSGSTFSNAPSAVIQDAGGTVQLTGASANFILTAGANSNTFNFSSGTLLFSGAAGARTLTLASADLGSAFSATNNNYFIGNLQLSGGAGYTLSLAGDASAALYVDAITLSSGATLDLAGKNIYYNSAQNLSGVTLLNGTTANIIQLGTGGPFVFLLTSGTQDYDTAGNWDRNLVPVASADQVRITAASATSVLITQNTAAVAFFIGDMIISNGGGGVSTLLAQRNMTVANGTTINTGGRLVVSSGVTFTSSLFVQGGTLTVNGVMAGAVSINGGTTDGTLTNNSTVTVNAGTLSGATRNQSGAIVNLLGGNVDGRLVNAAGGNILSTNGRASLVGYLDNSGAINLRNTGTLAGTGVLTNLSGGTINATAGGNIDARVVNASAATINATNGTLRLGSAAGLQTSGTMIVGNAATLDAVAAWNNGGTLTNRGGTVTGGIITNTSRIAGNGTILAAVVNTGGTLSVTGGTLTLNQMVAQTGVVNIDGAHTLVVNQAWNSGTVNFNVAGGVISGGTMTVTGPISVMEDSSIRGDVVLNSGAQITITKQKMLDLYGTTTMGGGEILGAGPGPGNTELRNYGTLTGYGNLDNNIADVLNFGYLRATNGTLRVAGLTTAAGSVIEVSTSGTLNSGANWSNNGTMIMSGGTVVGGTVANSSGQYIQGYGTFSNTVQNAGIIAATNGMLYVNRLITVAGGTMTVADGATLETGSTGGILNQGLLDMKGGVVKGGRVTNDVGGVIRGAGGFERTVVNRGTITIAPSAEALSFSGAYLLNQSSAVIAADTGHLEVYGIFTNTGTFTMLHSVGTFHSAVVNAGAWITDPTTNILSDTMTVTASGYIQATAGDVYVFTNGTTTAASFVNLSTNKTQDNTSDAKFLFSNTLGITQDFYTAAHDFGPTSATATSAVSVLYRNTSDMFQYGSNFAIGTLEISNFTTVRVSDAFIGLPGLGTNDNLTAALYLNNLSMGLNSLLIISSNVQVYFASSNNWNASNFILEGNAGYGNSISGLHQLILVPEPSVVLLWLGGFATLYARRRRTRALSRASAMIVPSAYPVLPIATKRAANTTTRHRRRATPREMRVFEKPYGKWVQMFKRPL